MSLNLDRTLVLHCRVPKAPIGECGELFKALFKPEDFKDGIPLPNGTIISLKEEGAVNEDSDQEDLEEVVKNAVEEVKNTMEEEMDEAVKEVATGFWEQYKGYFIGILIGVLLVVLLVLYVVCKGPEYLKNKFENFKKESAAKTTEIVYNTMQMQMQKLQTKTEEDDEEI